MQLLHSISLCPLQFLDSTRISSLFGSLSISLIVYNDRPKPKTCKLHVYFLRGGHKLLLLNRAMEPLVNVSAYWHHFVEPTANHETSSGLSAL